MKAITHLISARRRQLTSIVFLLATVGLLAFVAPPATASSELPFHANFVTQVRSFVEYPFLHVKVSGHGKATYMGTTMAFTDDQLVSLIDGSATATYTLTGINGDTLILTMAFQSTAVDGRRYFCRELHCYWRQRPIRRSYGQRLTGGRCTLPDGNPWDRLVLRRRHSHIAGQLM